MAATNAESIKVARVCQVLANAACTSRANVLLRNALSSVASAIVCGCAEDHGGGFLAGADDSPPLTGRILSPKRRTTMIP
jgi:hypothetical protein